MTENDLIDRDKLLNFVTRFRNAIEQVDHKSMAIGFKYFPKGACLDTSLLLGTALKENGLGTFQYVCARKSKAPTFESHAWLQADDLIIDITADQFDGMPSVFVGEDNGWYKSWDNVTDIGEGDFRKWGGNVTDHKTSYRLVMSKLI